jgi:hypothetical protein
MPLQLPNLDDRHYNELVAEALARIPTFSPEWTNYNPSDPGITLIELFAYLADMLLYRVNRVSDDNKRKFLKLLNGPDWVEPKNADLRDETRTTVLGIRERYRAVTRDDYEYLSTEGFNQSLINTQSAIAQVARSHCVPQRNLEAGTELDRLKLMPGHVSVLIVPGTDKSTPAPQPSADQISAVFSYLDERRMLTTKLHVTGPFYAPVAPQLVIARNSDAVESALRISIRKTLAALLKPLPSDSGPGWPFGRDVFASSVYQALENIPGIDFITDVMLQSHCSPGDDKCVAAEPIWHADGDFVGLNIEEHHLPIFRGAEKDVVIVANSAFVTVNIAVSARAHASADVSTLKRSIKSAVRGVFHPGLAGPGPKTNGPTSIYLSDIQVLIKQIPNIVDAFLTADCSPASTLQNDRDRGEFIRVPGGYVVDWRVAIQLN